MCKYARNISIPSFERRIMKKSEKSDGKIPSPIGKVGKRKKEGERGRGKEEQCKKRLWNVSRNGKLIGRGKIENRKER